MSRASGLRIPLQFLLVLTVVYSVTSASALPAKPQQIENLRIWHSPDSTRIVFDVSENVSHRMFMLDNPQRLVVDIENANISIKLPELDASNQHIQAIRSGVPRAQVLRFVFELKKTLTSTDFVLSPNELYGHRLVVDLEELQRTGDLAAQFTEKSTDSENPVASTIDDPIETLEDQRADTSQLGSAYQPPSNAQQATLPGAVKQPPAPLVVRASAGEPTIFLVAIDAGHGGEDPGALGHRGSREKQLTLQIAQRLKKIIDSDPNMQSYMVRRGDYYINLHKRRQMASLANADMFISIHADAFRKKSASGFSVFALSQSGATSAMARALAEKENASDLIGGVSLADKDELLAKVLVDLSMTNTISESVNLGGRVIKELAKLGKMHSKRVEQAGFEVLKSADIPSILVETGFITNPSEERKLKSKRYQQNVAQALYRAITEYYQQTPHRSNSTFAAPIFPGSRGAVSVSKRTTPSYHKVVRGDSLSSIALRYGISVRELKKLNKLNRDTAVLGKRLKIPGGGSRVANTKTLPTVHIVARGDSLSKVSKRYNVTIKSLKSVNGLRKDSVYIGQKLKIPGAGRVAASKPIKPLTHEVKRGDTLSEIAQRYGASMSKIMQLNSLRSRTVMLGQTLKIPAN